MFTLTACSTNWSFGNSLRLREEKTQEVTESFNGIEIDTDVADITLLPSEDGSCKVVSFDNKKITYSAKVEGGILKISEQDGRKWFQKMIGRGRSSLTVYLPERVYTSLTVSEDTGNITVPADFTFGSIDLNLSTGDVSLRASAVDSIRINLSTGDVRIENITCKSLDINHSTGHVDLNGVKAATDVRITGSTGNTNVKGSSFGNLKVATSTGDITMENVNCLATLEVSVSTGDVALTSISCKDFISEGDTGKLKMTGVIATGEFNITRDTGDVKFNGCDASEIYVKTDTGDVEGTLLTEKIFIVRSDTGKINVPESVTGGKCNIITDTGDVKISIE